VTLDKFNYILAVVEEQTLTRAAKKLYISQPTLTNYINKLEESLGVKLFDRSVTPIQVTKAGAVYIERMKRIQRESERLINEMRQMGHRQTVFNFGIDASRGDHWLPYIIPEFCHRYPNVSIQLHETAEEGLENGVLNGTIDLAVCVLNANYPGLVYEEITEETVFLAIPRTFSCVSRLQGWMATTSNPYRITPEEIGTIPFLLPYPESDFYRYVAFQMEMAGLVPSQVVRYSNMNTAYQLAGAGVGAVFITPAFFTRKYPEIHRNLAFCFLQNLPSPRRCVAGYNPNNPNLALIREMLTLIREKILPELDDQRA